MTEFEIGTPVPESAVPVRPQRGKYDEIWLKMKELKVNEALPVTCLTDKQAASIASAAQNRRSEIHMAIARRGLVVYLIKLEGPSVKERALARRALLSEGNRDAKARYKE